MSKKNKENDADKSCLSVPLSWYPGHMAKTKRQIIEDIKLIDVVIEILDARIPISSQNPDVKNIIGNKRKVIVLNKSDLADEKENIKWKEYFEQKGFPTVISDTNSGKGMQEVIKQVKNIMLPYIEQNSKSGRVGKSTRILIMGIPNVGKSSFINKIAKRSTTQVGNKPGVTKQKQWIKVSNNIELLDTPGVLWPKFENQKIALNLSFIGTIKDEILEITEVAYFLVEFLLKNYSKNIIERYSLEENELKQIMLQDKSENEKIFEIMELIGRKRGTILSGGNIDEEKLSKLILQDFRSGKLGKISIEKVEEYGE